MLLFCLVITFIYPSIIKSSITEGFLNNRYDIKIKNIIDLILEIEIEPISTEKIVVSALIEQKANEDSSFIIKYKVLLIPDASILEKNQNKTYAFKFFKVYSHLLIELTIRSLYKYDLFPNVWLSPFRDFEIVFQEIDPNYQEINPIQDIACYRNAVLELYNKSDTTRDTLSFEAQYISLIDYKNIIDSAENILFGYTTDVFSGTSLKLDDSVIINLAGIENIGEDSIIMHRARSFLEANILEEFILIKIDTLASRITGSNLGYIYKDDRCMNEGLLSAGLARVTSEYEFEEKRKYKETEIIAKKKGIGVWSK